MAHQDAAEDLSNLTAREKTLSSELYKLDTSQGVEEEIRQKYPLAKPGEEVIVLTAAKASTTTSSGSSSLWDEIVAWFSW
jgi:cell division protein FtsB